MSEEWEVEYTDQFEEWFDALTEDQQSAVYDRVEQLREEGPQLRRPVVGEIVTSRYPNMKELRASERGVLRVLFAFDPRRTAILLLGGNKTGQWDKWYSEAVPRADQLYEIYLRELRDEGLL
jgi:hypothetical protein